MSKTKKPVNYILKCGDRETNFHGDYRSARKEMTRTKKNWEGQINNMHPSNPKREKLISNYFDIKIIRR